MDLSGLVAEHRPHNIRHPKSACVARPHLHLLSLIWEMGSAKMVWNCQHPHKLWGMCIAPEMVSPKCSKRLRLGWVPYMTSKNWMLEAAVALNGERGVGLAASWYCPQWRRMNPGRVATKSQGWAPITSWKDCWCLLEMVDGFA